MTIRILEIYASTAIPIVELAIVEAPRSAAIGETGFLHASEDGVEFGLAHMEGVAVHFSNAVSSSNRRVNVLSTRTGAK